MNYLLHFFLFVEVRHWMPLHLQLELHMNPEKWILEMMHLLMGDQRD
jgi:hypothetical protein